MAGAAGAGADATTVTLPGRSLADRAADVASIAALHADDVDARARFPREAVDALRENGLLGAAVPEHLGGEGATVSELAAVATVLSEACSATGMIYVMHQIQVLCLTRHGGESRAVVDLLRGVASGGVLLASATTELGIGGNTRTSSCAVVPGAAGRVILEKTAPVISYGAYADAILTTARRTPDSVPSDQVLVLCDAADTVLTPISEWDTLGFRGTCSPGFELRADVPADHVLPAEYATISAETMLPVSHILWAAVWLGIANAATERARSVTVTAARKAIGTLPPSATRLAELLGDLEVFAALVRDSARTFDEVADDRAALTTIPMAMRFNSLKITSSETVIEIVSTAMLITGIAGYRLDSDVSVGRQLRDSYGTAVMVNNDRILANNAQLSLLTRKKAAR
ncbi:acyl-CoA dehydrogenase family protein [Frondihabitans peucedani]|uniref:Acyl-CoA dehydrogenase family protein n=1 Tax=Frondihabitans peucedani TaxID=598626 RepID=A0ABP8DZH0_9MICO